MSLPAKAILLKRAHRSFHEVIIHNHDEVAALLEVDIFCFAGNDNQGNYLLVDDEGLYRWPLLLSRVPRFYPEPLVGNILFTRSDACGETIDCPFTIDEVKAMVEFPSTPDDPRNN